MSATVLSGPFRRPARKSALPSPILGMIIFVVTEVMFFMALISSFMVIRSQLFSRWSPPGNLRLPVLATGFNTLVLLTSGALMLFATRAYAKPETKDRGQALFSQAILLGAFFVAFQGYEWIKLIGYGMTMTSGIFGATFFLLIGSHGLHALAAVLAMGWLYLKMRQGRLTIHGMQAMMIFWGFVVLLWPLLYGLVYFG